MSDNEMRACPFCGSTRIDPKGWMNGFGRSGPSCDGCGASAESVTEWNNRPALTDEQVREIAAAVRSWRETDDTDHTLEAAIREAIGRGEK